MKIISAIVKFFIFILPVKITDRLVNSFLPESLWFIKQLCRLDPEIFEYLSGKKALFIFNLSVKKVPAYLEFLKRNGISFHKIKTIKQFDLMVPQTSKENYVKIYPLTSRCMNGRLPLKGYIEESAGTSGNSTFWIKSAEEEADYHALVRTAMKHNFRFGRNKAF